MLSLNNNTSYSIDDLAVEQIVDLIYRNVEELRGKEISLYLVDEIEMRSLNRRYFGRDGATDILTFGSESPEETYLGELIINLDNIMVRKSSERNPLLKEILIHGVLHLMGYDHINTEEKKEMTERERRLLELIVLKGDDLGQ